MLELSNDFFIRTTDAEHKRLVQEFLQRVHDNGYVYKGFYEGWYCRSARTSRPPPRSRRATAARFI